MNTPSLGQALANTRWVAAGVLEDCCVIGRKFTRLLEKIDILGIIKKLNSYSENMFADNRIYEGITEENLNNFFAQLTPDHSPEDLIKKSQNTSRSQFNTALKTDSLVEALAIFSLGVPKLTTNGTLKQIQQNAIKLVEERASRFSLLGIENKESVLTFTKNFIKFNDCFVYYTKTHLDNIQEGSGNPFDSVIEV